MIPVTKSFLPPKNEYLSYIDQLWDSSWLTNNGVLVQELEKRLKDYLGVKHCLYVGNGTIALQIALKVLDIQGEVITTPYSYVATTNALLWETCKPVFVDIQEQDFSMNPDLIKDKITPNTQAILATHCYGISCNVERIKTLADENNLKIIYDAAHAFGVKRKGTSILNYGNLSTLSFHATKLFHTVEGGAIICHSDEMAEKIKLYRSFGHKGDNYFCLGINGKNSEFHAAMGLSVFPYIVEILDKRKELFCLYDRLVGELNEFKFSGDFEFNYSYYPFVTKNEASLLILINKLEGNAVFPRRYFYPSLNSLPFLNNYQSCPVAEDISKRVICLPMYHELTSDQVLMICSLIKEVVV